MTATSRRARLKTEDSLEISSDGGVLRFRLKRRPTGVHVTRLEVRPGGSSVEHVAVFRSPADFERFCRADSLRFTYPLVMQQVQREFDAVFHDIPRTAPAPTERPGRRA